MYDYILRFWHWLFPRALAQTQGMKVLIQWAQKDPTGWQEVNSHDWASLPKRAVPTDIGGRDNILGWIRNVSVQGLTAEGFDHVAIEPITIGNDEGVVYTLWNDDPGDAHVDGFEDWINEPHAVVWTILPLAPDPKLGMAINTRQSCVRYAQGERYDRLLANIPQNTTVRPWKEFVAPDSSITLHGVWLEDAKFAEHIALAPQAEYGWMDWADHLPDTEVELVSEIMLGGISKPIAPRRRLKEQRSQGRYHQAEHTITYYQRNADRAVGWAAYTNEDALETTTTTSATETVTTNSGTVRGWSFTTPADNPNFVDWPSGDYHAQLNCTAASVTSSYGLSSLVFAETTFINGNSALTAINSSFSGESGTFAGTGLKLATASWDPASGAASDVFSFGVYVIGSSHGDAVTLQLNTTDSYADGPWTAAGANPPGWDNQDLIITS